MSAPHRITVLMTLYNKGAFVQEAVRSVLAQTFTDFELLIVDDASTDGGLAQVKAIADPRIRILESAVNTGRAAAANRGYEAASGDYVAVIDADDRMMPQRLEKQVAFMDAHPEVGASGTAYRVMGASASIMSWPATDDACRCICLFGNPLWYGSAILRRSVIEAHGLRCDPGWLSPGMDYLFLLRFFHHARYANLPEVLMEYRMGNNNMAHGRDNTRDKALLLPAVFRQFGLSLTEAQLDLQLALHALFRKPFTAAQVGALWAWKQELSTLNRNRQLFPVDLFEAELDHRWSRLFHFLADQDLGAALAHLQLSSHLTGRGRRERLMYLTKTTLGRWSGRGR